MKLRGGFLIHPRELCNRMHIFVSTWMLPLMTSHLCILILSSLAVSSQLGLEDVFFSPHDQTVREGEGVFFQCVSGESSPPASITWLKDGTLVKRGRHIQGEYGGGNQKKTSGTLHLFNVTLEDDGMYICVTRNALLNISKRSKPAKLTVQGVPRRLQIIQGPDNITAAMGTEVSMHCDVGGFPVPMVHWFKDGCLLANCSASFSLHNNGQLLTFRNVTKEDEGSYHCEASNQEESIKSQSAFLLPAEMDWRFIQQPTNLTVRRGENATVTCRPPYSKPAAQVSWFKNNHLLTPTAHSTVLPSGDLFFTSVQEFDSGSYFCRASNIHLQRFLTSRRAALTVQAPPSVKLWPQVLTVPVGARVVLECQVSGHPLPSISWVKRGHSKQTGGKIALGLRNATLYIQSARSYDEGVYVCEASNTLGHSHNTAMLRVTVSPIIVTSVGQVSCRIGASAVLPCKAVGILPITYNWTKGRAETQSPISFNEGKHIDEDGALHISSVQYHDAGEYYCTAENRAGRHQRRTILTVTAEHHPADKGRQTRLVLSASNNTSKKIPAYQTDESVVEQHPKTAHQPHVKTPRDEATCSLSHCDVTTSSTITSSTVPRGAVAELKMPRGSHGRLLQHHLSQPTTKPTQPLVTQMQPPMLPPPPHPNFQSVHFHAHSQTLAVTSKALDTTVQYVPVLTEHLSHLTLTSSRTQFERQGSDVLLIKPDSKGSKIHAVTLASQITEFVTETSVPQPTNPPVGRSFSSLMLDSYLPTTNQSPETNNSGSSTVPTASQEDPTQLHQLVTENEFHQSYHQPTLTQISQTKLEDLGRPLQQRTHSPTLSQIPPPVDQQSFTQRLFPKFHLELPTTQHYLASTQPSPISATKPQQFNSQPLPALSRPTSTISTLPQNQPRPSPTQHPLVHAQSPPPQTEAFSVQRREPSIPTLHPPDQTSHPSTSAPEIRFVHLVNTSDQVQLNNSQQGDTVQSVKTPNDTELTEWLKRNTSQSPMTSNDPRVTQQSPSWLPVLEKHDIPIVVGVGVSLAFIFITVTFYSVVQKNEPAPTSRAEPIYMSLTAQRNLGVPLRHAERRAAGRTYENRAFEDDDCVAVIEQSPNTSETRARPPGPSLVTVQMEPTFEDLQDDTQPALDNHSVTVETYPEPILDTKIDPCLEEEKGRSLSQPSIQLQCTEDWTSNRGDNRSPCQDALPPPSSLPSRSPSPSPPSRPGEGLRSSLTLQSAEACAAPIHHSLSISHGNPPLLLSHHVSLGLTTVAVDVHFYPAATASMAVCTSTHINSVANSTSAATPLFTPPLVNSQDNDQSAARYPQSK